MDQYSPKSSPRPLGASSSRSQDSTTSGTLKTTICLGKTPSIVHTGPFYLMKELPPPSEQTGASNLMAIHNLEHAYNKCSGKKVKDQLSSFLPNLPGSLDSQGSVDGSSLRAALDNRMVPKELLPLSTFQLGGFRLHPGSLPEPYRYMTQSPTKSKKHKQKRKRHRGGYGGASGGDSTPEAPVVSETMLGDQADLPVALKSKHKKTKKHGDEERRKKKKEKKKKRQKDSSPPPISNVGIQSPGGI